MHSIQTQGTSARRLGLYAVVLVALPLSSIANPQDVTYAELVKNPTKAKQDVELKAYLLGVVSVIKLEYMCPQTDRQKLSDPSKIIDELVEFSQTPWGSVCLTPTGFGTANIPIPMYAGTALLQIFTEHSRCIRHEQPRPQN